MFKRFYTILLVSYGPRPLRNAHELCPLKQVANYSSKTGKTDQYICIKRTTINPLTPKSD